MKVNKLLVMFLIIAMTIPIISYAINLPTEEQQFFTSDKNEATKGEVVTLTINLNLIEYEDFEFTLTSNTNLENISTKQDDVDISTDKNSFKIIASKTELNIEQIALYYQLPEEIEIGTKIELTGIVKEYIKDEEQTDEAEAQEVTISITVVENKEENENQNNNMNEPNNEQNSDNKINMEQIKQEENNESKTSTTQVQSKSVASNLSQSVETNTYNGESNNYLSTLEIQGLDFIPQFAKTNTTYFIEVSNDVTEIQITAEAEDDNATVNIYGNTDLQTGKNKVLISVTAENGDVKIYRIYVTKNS